VDTCVYESPLSTSQQHNLVQIPPVQSCIVWECIDRLCQLTAFQPSTTKPKHFVVVSFYSCQKLNRIQIQNWRSFAMAPHLQKKKTAKERDADSSWLVLKNQKKAKLSPGAFPTPPSSAPGGSRAGKKVGIFLINKPLSYQQRGFHCHRKNNHLLLYFRGKGT